MIRTHVNTSLSSTKQLAQDARKMPFTQAQTGPTHKFVKLELSTNKPLPLHSKPSLKIRILTCLVFTPTHNDGIPVFYVANHASFVEDIEQW